MARSTNAIEGIENLVLSFLSQLSLSLPPIHDDDDDSDGLLGRKKTKTKKIELVLADRKKPTPDGYCMNHSFLIVINSEGTL